MILYGLEDGVVLIIDGGRSVQQTSDGGYIVMGTTNGLRETKSDMWLIKTDLNGDSVWTRTYGMENYDGGVFAEQTDDGGYILIGTVRPALEESAIWLLKTDSLGDTTWTRTYRKHERSWGTCGRQTLDGGYIIIGNSYKYENEEGYVDIWLLKTDAQGDTLWTRTFGSDTGYDMGYCVDQTPDGGYILTGFTDPERDWDEDLWLIKTDANGDTASITKRAGDNEENHLVVSTPVGREIVLEYQYSPNGFHAAVFDASGRKVDELEASGSSGTITWGQGQNPGVYFIRADGARETRKVVIIR